MLNRLASLARVDFAPSTASRPPGGSCWRHVASVAGSLAADAILVVTGKAVFPSTRGFAHFQFSDYAKLTVIGVIIACVAWPIVTRISPAPRWLFFRLAILVTLVLLLPDLYLLHMGEPAEGVFVLMAMHVAIALVTYNLLVRLAPARPAAGGSPGGSPPFREPVPASRDRSRCPRVRRPRNGCPSRGAARPGTAPARPLTPASPLTPPGPGLRRDLTTQRHGLANASPRTGLGPACVFGVG